MKSVFQKANDEFLDAQKVASPLSPDFKLYIEGVEVPFNQIIVSSVYGSLPSARITVPYLPYLQEISRNYRPKVHIFFSEESSRRDAFERGVNDPDHVYKVLFIGEIVSSTYSKSKTPFNSSSDLSFTCVHKNSAIEELTMRTASFGLQEGSIQARADAAQANAPVILVNKSIMAQQVIQGVNTQKEFDLSNPKLRADPSGVPKHLKEFYAGNFRGIPGVILRLWNMICVDALNHSSESDVMSRLYIPLITNLGFFQGIVGHSIVEKVLESNRAVIPQNLLSAPGSGFNGAGDINRGALSPAFASFGALAAFASSLQVASMNNVLNPESEALGFMQFIRQLLGQFFYEVITLSSPVQRFNAAKDGAKYAAATSVSEKNLIIDDSSLAPAETIVKPIMPMYFAPKCNVLYPKMYSSIQIEDNCAEAPTRVEVLVSHIANTKSVISMDFRSPPSLRAALYERSTKSKDSIKSALDSYTLIGSTPAVHELGRGVKSKAMGAPEWMTLIAQKAEGEMGDQAAVQGFKELLTQYADYEYSLAVTSTRTGAVEGIFNPYIIPGYPMDIIDPGSYRPSYHAFCTSATTSISASGSVTTSIGFTNAVSYDELYLIETPMALPWLNKALKMEEKGSVGSDAITYAKLTELTDADIAIKNAANEYYQDVLGVDAAFPDALCGYKYAEQKVKPPALLRTELLEIATHDATPEQSILLCRRPIQTRKNVEQVYGLKLVHTSLLRNQLIEESLISPQGITSLTSSTAFDPTPKPDASTTVQMSFTRSSRGRLSPGLSPFLDYSGANGKGVDVEFIAGGSSVDTMRPAKATVPASSSQSNQKASASTGKNKVRITSNTRFAVKEDWRTTFSKLKSNPATAGLAKIFEQEEARFRSSFPDYPPNLFLAMIHSESSFKPNAVGPTITRKNGTKTNAFGFGQFVKDIWFKSHPELFNNEKLSGQAANAKYAAKYLTQIKRMRGFTWNDAVIGYNMGPGRLAKLKAQYGGEVVYNEVAIKESPTTKFNQIFDTSKPLN